MFTFTFSNFADAFIQSDLQLGEYIKRLILKRQTDRGRTCLKNCQKSLKNCSNKYELAKEGEKDKEEGFFFFII